MSTEEVLATWRPKLREGARRMLDVLIAYEGREIPRDQLFEESGLTASGTANTYLSDLRTAQLAVSSREGVAGKQRNFIFVKGALMAKKKQKKSKPKPKSKPVVKKSPRQEALPGLEDRAIKAIDTAAMDYADTRDQRQALTQQEHSLKEELLQLMKKHKKTHYKHGAIEINLVHESETVKVRVKDENEEKPDDTQPEEEEVELTDEDIIALDADTAENAELSETP